MSEKNGEEKGTSYLESMSLLYFQNEFKLRSNLSMDEWMKTEEIVRERERGIILMSENWMDNVFRFLTLKSVSCICLYLWSGEYIQI